MYTFHLEAAQPDTGKLSSTAADPAVLEVRRRAAGRGPVPLRAGWGGAAAAGIIPGLACLSTHAGGDLAQVCQAVRASGMHCGIALKPSTAPELVFPYVEAGLVDLVRLAQHGRWSSWRQTERSAVITLHARSRTLRRAGAGVDGGAWVWRAKVHGGQGAKGPGAQGQVPRPHHRGECMGHVQAPATPRAPGCSRPFGCDCGTPRWTGASRHRRWMSWRTPAPTPSWQVRPSLGRHSRAR